MDGFSAAASGIAVASIGIQLAENVKKLYDFWISIKDVPEDIREISMDLQLLSTVLAQIACEAQHIEPDATFIAALDGCWLKVKILNTLLNEIEPGFASTSSRIRKWSAFKAVLKSEKLRKFQEALERLKGTLLLVQQNQYSRLSRNRHIVLERGLTTVTQGVYDLSTQQQLVEKAPSTASDVHSNGAASCTEEWGDTDDYAGDSRCVQSNHSGSGSAWSKKREQTWVKRTLTRNRSVMEYFLGTVHIDSSTKLQTLRETSDLASCYEQDQQEHETSCVIYPALWLIRLGIQHGLRLGFLSSSTQGWKHTLNFFCPVPDDALIFEFCRQGNVPAVRSLLSGGHASVRDTDSRGYTPLHFAAQKHHPELCKVLKGAGADVNAFAHDEWTPLRLAAWEVGPVTHSILSDAFDTLRLFTDSMDFSEEDGDGWEVLLRLSRCSINMSGDIDAKSALLLWMLRLSSFELKTYSNERSYVRLMAYTLPVEPELNKAAELLLNIGGDGAINLASRTSGYTILHNYTAWGMWEAALGAVLARGPDLHRLGSDAYYTPQVESPTSLAMYSSRAFWYWVRALANFKMDFEEFIGKELEQSPLARAGWEKETLLSLFIYGFGSDLYRRYLPNCSDCTRYLYGVKIQPYWQHLLERIKQRLDPDNPAHTVSELVGVESADVHSIGEDEYSFCEFTHKSDTPAEISPASLDVVSPELEEFWEGAHGYPAMVDIRSDCIYGRDEVLCMCCWLDYVKFGTRRSSRPQHSWSRDLDAGEDSSDDDFSPFLVHS